MTPEEIARDKAIAAVDDVTGTWTNSDGKRKPGKSVFIAETATEELDIDGSGRPSRYGPNRDYVCNAFTVERAAAIANAHNRLPAYIAEAEETARRTEAMERRATMLLAAQPDDVALRIHVSGMREVLEYLRSDQ